jgi:hypothetical protein
MEPRYLFGQPVYADDHRGRYVGRFEEPAPLRGPLTITGEYDCLGRIRRDVHRDLTTSVVVEQGLGDELPRYRVATGRFPGWFGTPCAAEADYPFLPFVSESSRALRA